jgi:hypothetical protein
LRDADPAIPPGLSDRAADVWEPLLAIADLAGGEWPARARLAAQELSGDGAVEDDSLGVQILRDIRDVLNEKGADRIASAELAAALGAIEESPWAPVGSRSFDARALAKALKPHKIRPKQIRIGEETLKGYLRAWFEPAWARYAPVAPASERNNRNNVGLTGVSHVSATETEASVFRSSSAEKALFDGLVSDVSDRQPDTGPRPPGT